MNALGADRSNELTNRARYPARHAAAAARAARGYRPAGGGLPGPGRGGRAPALASCAGTFVVSAGAGWMPTTSTSSRRSSLGLALARRTHVNSTADRSMRWRLPQGGDGWVHTKPSALSMNARGLARMRRRQLRPGRRSCQSVARCQNRPARSSTASLNQAASRSTPMGRPPLLKPQGSDRPGRPASAPP